MQGILAAIPGLSTGKCTYPRALPLATEEGNIDMLLVCAIVTPAPRGEPPPVQLKVL